MVLEKGISAKDWPRNGPGRVINHEKKLTDAAPLLSGWSFGIVHVAGFGIAHGGEVTCTWRDLTATR